MSFRMFVIGSLVLALGCAEAKPTKPVQTSAKPQPADPADAEVQKELAKLSPDERALVEAQDLCPVTDEKLGSMGAPIKLMIKDKPVYICCSGCKKKAEADPDKTIARVEELKNKKANPAKG